MDLNLKKNLFRYGKNEPLTFGVILALILFDILIWTLISKGMISVDYRFASNNDCQSQVWDVLNTDMPRLVQYTHKTGKYCALLQQKYDQARTNTIVVDKLDQIRQTQNDISRLEQAVREGRYALDGNATAYGLAIQEQKGLDLDYTTQLTKIREKEKTLAQLRKELDQQKRQFKTLDPIQHLVQYAQQNKTAIFDRYRFMQRVDVFLTYIFAMLFIVILIPIFMLMRNKMIQKGKYIRLLLVNHIIFVAALQAIWKTIRFILRILPETLLHNLLRFFRSLHLMALWYYLAILLLFLLFAAVVYFLQTKGRRKNLYKKLIKGKCWCCGAKVLDNEFCFSCGEKQLRICPHCRKKTYVKMPYCRVCGKELSEE